MFCEWSPIRWLCAIIQLCNTLSIIMHSYCTFQEILLFIPHTTHLIDHTSQHFVFTYLLVVVCYTLHVLIRIFVHISLFLFYYLYFYTLCLYCSIMYNIYTLLTPLFQFSYISLCIYIVRATVTPQFPPGIIK